MLVNAEKLAQRIQIIQKFAADRAPQDVTYAVIQQSLDRFLTLLRSGNLTVRIFSQEGSQAEALAKLLHSQTALHAYEFDPQELSAVPVLDATAAPVLTLQTGSAQPTYFELATSHSQIIGRNPTVSQLLLPDGFSLISGRHVEVQPLNAGNWRIRDLDSRNGTFINGSTKRLEGWHSLQLGDRVHLGSATQAPGSARLVFDYAGAAAIDAVVARVQTLLDCNILLLIVDPNHPLTESNQRLLQWAVQAQIYRLYIIIDRPGNLGRDVLQAAMSQINTWIEQQSWPTVNIEVMPLLLQPFVPTSGATILAPNAQPEFDQLCQGLEELANIQSDRLIVHRVTQQVLGQIDRADRLLQTQEKALNGKIQQGEAKLQSLMPNDLRDQMKKALKKTSDDREQLFRQIKNEVGQSKAAILDEFRKKSIPQQIQQFSKTLRPVVVDRSGYRYVSLKLENNHSVHAAALDLCYALLSEWGAKEWQRITTVYGDGGLQGLLQRSVTTLAFTPELDFSSSELRLANSPNFQQILQISSAEPVVEARFKQPGPIGYLVKNLKGQVISGVATVALLAQVVNWVLQLIAGTGNQGNNTQNTLKIAITAGILLICLIVMPIAYKQDKEEKTKETAEKLQKETMGYYQSFSKGLVDRFVQQLTLAVETEEKRFREFLETVNDRYTAFAADFERNYLQLKATIEDSKKVQQKNLERDAAELQKFRKELSN